LEWVYLILILAFVAWSVQMLMTYRRQIDRLQAQIDLALTNQGEVSEQAEHYENLSAEKKELLKELEEKAGELAVQSASSTVNDENRSSINAEFVQLINEIDRIGSVTSYNNSTLLSGYGNTVNGSAAVSSALNGVTTGLTNVQISGAAAGNYTFLDAGTGDNQITLTNGVVSQTIDIGPALDNDGSGVVATGGSIVANFDRLGIQLTLSGARPAQGPVPATDGYRDGDLDGTALVINAGTGGRFQVGPDDAASHRIEINIRDMRASGAYLGMGSQSVDTLAAAQSAISNIDLAIGKVAGARGDLGAFQNRLGFNVRNSENAIENNQASESSIRDADVALEVEEFTRSQILVQSTTSMLAQANVIPQSALSLLQ
jgi:flagellin